MPRFRPAVLFAMLWILAIAGAAAAPPRQQFPGGERREEFKNRHAEGVELYHKRHDEAAALAFFEALERDTREAGDDYWRMCAVWKLAQIHSGAGRQVKSMALFEEAKVLIDRLPAEHATANHFLLFGNLVDGYRAIGRMGQAAIHQAEASEVARRYCAGKVPVGPEEDGFLLGAERLRQLPYFRFVGNVFLGEAQMRFEAGREAEAVSIATQVEERVKVGVVWWEDQLRQEAQELLIEWLDALGRFAERDACEARLLVPAGEARHGSVQWRIVRMRQSERRHREGADAAPLFAAMDEDLAALRRTNHLPQWMAGRALLARMHAREGRTRLAEEILAEGIAEARGLEMPFVLAELYLTRAELWMDQGRTEGVESDLFTALDWFRRNGGLRREAEAYLDYARLLRLDGRLVPAHAMLTEATAKSRRYASPVLRRRVEAEWTALEGALASLPPTSFPREAAAATSDLQPIEVVTRVAPGAAASARFAVTNPAKERVDGMLHVAGRVSAAAWDERGLVWRVMISDTAPLAETRQKVRLESLDQARVILEQGVARPEGEAVEVGWTVAHRRQTAWWRFTSEGAVRGPGLGNDNLALGNPFYAVPLHHAVRAGDAAAAIVMDLRVRTGRPCRVEIVRDSDGRVLAVDAQGDGDFRGAGDVLTQDSNRDGYPDLELKAGEDSGVELYVYPPAGGAGVSLRLEGRIGAGAWTTQATDDVLGD